MIDLLNLYETLREEYGHQGWWPGETRFEIIVGAILTQNTSWSNVERAIERMRRMGLFSIERILDAPIEILWDAIRPSGYFRIKSERLLNFFRMVRERFSCDLDEMATLNLSELRETVLSVNGIGPETADSIVLYAFEKPTFVIDAYTKRILARLGLVDEDAGYYVLKELFETHLPESVELFKDYHAQFVVHAKKRCKKRLPLCEGCPLKIKFQCPAASG